MGFIDFLVHQFETNQFLTAAVLAAPAAVFTYSVRAIPAKIWWACKRGVTVELRFNSDMNHYHKVQRYIVEHVVKKSWSRNFNFHYEETPGRRGSSQKAVLGVGYGAHIGVWGGRPVFVHRNLEQGNQTEHFKESVTVTFLTRGNTIPAQFVETLQAYLAAGDPDTIELYTNEYDHWRNLRVLTPRKAATVVTADQSLQQAIHRIRQFETCEADYVNRGLPYHMGILLTGLPGTGKTSFIHALATECKRNIYYLNLANIQEEAYLTSLLGSQTVFKNSLLVIEDFDVAGTEVKREKTVRTGVSLSSLLNSLDGILTPHGLIVVGTTNHPESLDPALLRPGRFDVKIELKPLTWLEFVQLAKLFHLEIEQTEALQKVYIPQTGATLRGLLLAHNYTELVQHFVQLNTVDAAV